MKVVEPEIMRIGTMADSRASSDIDLFVDLNFGALNLGKMFFGPPENLPKIGQIFEYR